MTYFRFTLLTLTLLTLASCTDDFSLEGEFQDVPTAYAFFDAEDDRHFVKVQKAFLEAGGNALTNAAIADSIYYGENEATVILVNKTNDDEVVLDRVDGDDFDLEREEGIFATEPNILYSVRDRDINLRGGDEIELRIERPGEEDAIATTNMLEPFIIRSPGDMVRVDDYNRPLGITWGKVDNAEVYDIRLIFEILEFFPDDPDRNQTVLLEFQVAAGYVPRDQGSSSNVTFSLANEDIYRFLGSNLEVDNGVRRRFSGFSVQVTAAGTEVLERRALATANAGITSSQALPRYTNLVGGIGLVTSTTTSLKEGIDFDTASRDSLRNGFYTDDLNFL